VIHAGLITSITRAKLLDALAYNPSAIVMLATDGVYSSEKLPLALGEDLGQWEFKEHSDIFIIQPGVYHFPNDDKAQLKTRGVPKRKMAQYNLHFQQLWEDYYVRCRMEKIEFPNFAPRGTVFLPIFIGLQLAYHRGNMRLAGQWLQDCNDSQCSHEHCGSKTLSFDWTKKRERGRWEDTHIKHFPITGDISNVSVAYDPHKRLKELGVLEDTVEVIEELNEFRIRDTELDAMPDYMDTNFHDE
jgi:hypothetical protein